MAELKTANDLAQRALDVGIVDDAQLQAVWSDLGTRNVSLEEFEQAMLRTGSLTNYQLDRLVRDQRGGYFYGDYKILYCVGSGTFARVFRAAHKETGKLYAVKVLRNRYSDKPEDVELFRREGELGRSLQHANIVPTHEVFSKGFVHYIVMDFIEGRNLREFYKVRKKFEPLEAARIVADIAAGLNYALQQGVTHRDLKMSNVLVSSNGTGMLVDFGLAGLDDDGEAKNQRSIDYAGLERSTGVHKDDTRSDIFFAGCIFYQLLAGVPPMSETRDRVQRLAKARYQEIKPLKNVAPDVPFPIAVVVGKAIEFDPEKRYQTPGDMLMDLRLAVKRVKQGGSDKPKTATELVSQDGLNEQGEPRRLMVVESDGRMQDVFRKLFKKHGYRVLVSVDPHRALTRLFEDQSTADQLLISAATIGDGAVEVFNRLGKERATQGIPAVLLLGEHQQDWESQAEPSEKRLVVKMPIKPTQLCRALVDSRSQSQVAPATKQ